MFEKLIAAFQGTPLSLWGPFAVLLLCGLGLPVPEDIVLVAAGALGQSDGRSWMFVSGLMYAGVLAGDSTLFFSGRWFGGWLLRTVWFQRFCPPMKQQKVAWLYEQHGAKGMFIGRFLPGLRAPIFFTAGSMKVPFWKFLFFDGLAALLSVPFFVWLGHWLWAKFRDDIQQMNEALAKTHRLSYWLALGLGAVLVLVVWRWRKKAKRA